MSCLHCGDPCAASAVVTDRGAFCCAGCESVFTLLHTLGLGAFYACDVPPGTSQRAGVDLDRSVYAALDDPAIRSRFVVFEDGGLAQAVFRVPALHCASCVWLIERLWRIEPAIVRADVDLVRQSVRIAFRPDEIALRGVAERLAQVGYAPLLDQEQRQAGMPPARRSLYLKLGVAGFAFGNAMLFSIPRYVNGGPLDGGFQALFDSLNLALALPVLLYSSSDYFLAAWNSLRQRTLSLDVPIAIGLTALFGRSVADITLGYGEGFTDSFTGLVFFLLIGRLFQQKAFDRIAFDRSFRSFLPLSVQVERESGHARVPLDQVRPGDVMAVRPHEIVPADAFLEGTEGAVDYAFLTGEERPVPVARGELVRAGGRVVSGTLRLRVQRPVSHSRLADLWNNPIFAKPKTYWLSGLSDRVGAWFTVAAVSLAVAGAVAWWPDGRRSAEVFTAVLIVACPCALTLAAPITLGTAMAVLGRLGFYLKHPAVALDLSRVSTIAFDKTGTLTAGSATARAEPIDLTPEHWSLVRRLAAESIHPASRAITAAGLPVAAEIAAVRETAGAGLRGQVNGHDVVLGTPAFVAAACRSDAAEDDGRICVGIDGVPVGRIRIWAPDRPGVQGAAAALASNHDVVLLSGDHDHEAARWRGVFGTQMSFRQSPEDKLALVRGWQAAGAHVLMVGDGLNDAGALGAADVGVAVSDESACVVPACDAVISGDRLADLPAFVAYARRARDVIVAAVLISFAYNVVGVSFALRGMLTPLATAILMPLSSLTVIALAVGAMRWWAPVREGTA